MRTVPLNVLPEFVRISVPVPDLLNSPYPLSGPENVEGLTPFSVSVSVPARPRAPLPESGPAASLPLRFSAPLSTLSGPATTLPVMLRACEPVLVSAPTR